MQLWASQLPFVIMGDSIWIFPKTDIKKNASCFHQVAFLRRLGGIFASFFSSHLFDLNLWLKSGGRHFVMKVAAPGSPRASFQCFEEEALWSTTSLSPSFVASCLSICYQWKPREIYPKITYSVSICRGADLSALVREASICALRQEMALQNTQSKKGKTALQKP